MSSRPDPASRGSERSKADVRGMAIAVLLWTCALPMFLGAAYMLTVQPIVTLQRDNDVRRQLIGNTVSSRPSGTGPVILEGRIDPELVVPPDAGGLALVERETLRTDSSWRWDLLPTPILRSSFRRALFE